MTLESYTKQQIADRTPADYLNVRMEFSRRAELIRRLDTLWEEDMAIFPQGNLRRLSIAYLKLCDLLIVRLMDWRPRAACQMVERVLSLRIGIIRAVLADKEEDREIMDRAEIAQLINEFGPDGLPAGLVSRVGWDFEMLAATVAFSLKNKRPKLARKVLQDLLLLRGEVINYLVYEESKNGKHERG